jgi:hypothetical protein
MIRVEQSLYRASDRLRSAHQIDKIGCNSGTPLKPKVVSLHEDLSVQPAVLSGSTITSARIFCKVYTS